MPGFCELKSKDDLDYIDFDAKVMITAYKETLNVLDGDNAGRGKLRGRMIRDVLGGFLGHTITFQRDGSVEGFDALWAWLKKHSVDDSIWIKAADGQGTIEYEAYFTVGEIELDKEENGVRYYKAITVNFIPMDPQLIPD